MGALSDFLDGLDEPRRTAMTHLVEVARQVAPEAEEGTSYGVAALRLHGRPLIGLAAAESHLSLFPFSPAVVEAVAADLEGYSLAKGTIRFTVEQPLPDEVIARVVALRAAEL